MSIHKLFKTEKAVHVLTVLFGLTSLANVNAFLRGAGHDPAAALVLSVALGAALIVVSIALTKIDWGTERTTFRALVTVGLALGVISGALQSSEYGAHLRGLWPYLLGYGIPLIGEVGLSLAAALFARAQARSELRAVNAKMERAIIKNLDDAIDGFDPSKIRARIDRSLNGIAARAVDGVTAELLAVYDAPAVTSETTEATTQTGAGTVARIVRTPEEMNAVKQAKKQGRMDAVLRLIELGTLGMDEIASQAEISVKTLGRYIKDFQAQGHPISVNGVVKLEG